MAKQQPAVDSRLTGQVKAFALNELNADLVGVANIERFEHAPRMMSPQGILPTARSVVVMAVHHPDAAIELGGETHPQEIGPYRVQYIMNMRLDEMAYRMGLLLEREGWASVPIVSSNIWRYKGYKELTEHFAPDISHRHAAVAAGLADFGYSALAITPEYGARVRFISVITEAVLEPSPLIEPGTVCDDCRLCVENCLSRALAKEIRGTSIVRIEDKQYTYADKNLWRCAWGEHFDLDLDLPIPDVVDEDVILENVCQHGRRGGEMGSCLRYCVPAARRVMDLSYSSAPRRLRLSPENDEPHRGFEQQVQAIAYANGLDFTAVATTAQVQALGQELTTWLPEAKAAVVIGIHHRRAEGADTTGAARVYLLDAAAYDVARELERRGYDGVSLTDFPEATWQGAFEGVGEDRAVVTRTILTTAPLEPTSRRLNTPRPAGDQSPAALKQRLRRLAAELELDAVGVAPADRLAALQPHLAAIYDGREVLVARDQSGYFQPYDPVVRTETLRVKSPSDHLAGAKSVIVLALRLPRASVECTAKPPAEAVGPYAFAQYEAVNMLRRTGFRVMRWLEDAGFKAALTFDLTGTGSAVGNPRGEQPDAFCGRFEAVAAGLGRLTKGGFVVTPELGANVRFVAIVTDAAIEADDTLKDDGLTAACDGCDRCLQACHTAAHEGAVEVPLDGVVERFHVIEHKRCDWAKRYSLIGEEGVNFLGWNLHLPAPDVITVEALAEGLKQQPAIPKYRPCNFEACVLACPMSRTA